MKGKQAMTKHHAPASSSVCKCGAQAGNNDGIGGSFIALKKAKEPSTQEDVT